MNSDTTGRLTALSFVVLASAIASLQEPYRTILYFSWIALAGVAAAVPAPTPGSKWVGAYRILNLIAANAGQAVSYLAVRYGVAKTPQKKGDPQG